MLGIKALFGFVKDELGRLCCIFLAVVNTGTFVPFLDPPFVDLHVGEMAPCQSVSVSLLTANRD